MDSLSSKISATMKKIVSRAIGWACMGTALIVAFVLGIVAACLAANNHEGVTSIIVIGSLAEAFLLCGCAFSYFKKKQELANPVAQEPASIEDEHEVAVEAAPVVEEPVVEAVVAEEVVKEPVIEEIVEEPVQEEIVAEVAADEEVEPIQETEEAPVVEEIAEEPVVEEPVVEEPVVEEPVVVVSAEEARDTMSDDEALALIEVRSKAKVDGPMCTVNVGVLSATFAKNEEVTLYALQAKGLVPRKQNGYIVLAKGTINKPLTVVANDFSADAVKMIVAAGGKAIGC